MENEKYVPPKFWPIDVATEDVICTSLGPKPPVNCSTLQCTMNIYGDCYQDYCQEVEGHLDPYV